MEKAVQYHPESIKTSRGLEVMANFWRLAVEWSTRQGRDVVSWSPAAEKIFGSQWPTFQEKPSDHTPKTVNTVVYRRVVAHTMSVTEICEAMDLEESSSPFVLLESVADPGRFSIIGVLHADSPRFTHYAGDRCVNVFHGQAHLQEDLGEHNVWSWAASYMRARRFTGGNPSIPFWGGLVGYISYEMGVSGLGIARPTPSSGIHHGNPNHKHHPDVNLVYVERSIVHDKQNGFLYVQSLLPSDRWICDTVALLGNDNISIRSLKLMRSPCPVKAERPMAKLPSKDQYISRIRRCQEYLATGESYELCLTARTHVTLSPSSSFNSSWELYKSARRHNPAPYSAYLSLHPSTIISTSPERFLSFSRSPNVRCQLRPIKGTVRKTHVVDRMVAEQLLAGSKKEVAENLMIVDLIRHDLHGIVGPDVEVTQFCGIEEYETVWQMVSVIEGQLNQPNPGDEDELGWEVLRSSLPPGSMTGAPKKRSVEILNTLEDDQRGIYSGVLGYWDVGGGGDWAVTIRTCVHHADDPRSGTDGTTWTIGAGGAITALSDPEAEWEEMLLKLQGVLNAFRDP
jgi:para-aminobenzoate synthetase